MCMRMYMYARACVMVGVRVCVWLVVFVLTCYSCRCLVLQVRGLIVSYIPKGIFRPGLLFACIGKCARNKSQNVTSQKIFLYFVKIVMQFAHFSTRCLLRPVEIHNRVSSGERLGQKRDAVLRNRAAFCCSRAP